MVSLNYHIEKVLTQLYKQNYLKKTNFGDFLVTFREWESLVTCDRRPVSLPFRQRWLVRRVHTAYVKKFQGDGLLSLDQDETYPLKKSYSCCHICRRIRKFTLLANIAGEAAG